MEKIKRNERLSAMVQILANNPNKIFTLSHFCELFGAAKSTMSEDVEILQRIMGQYELGKIETLAGAAGGVRFRAYVSKGEAVDFITQLSLKLSTADRVLPGGFL